MSVTQVAADLRAAAEVLKRDGWTQGKFTDADGCHCVLGAFGALINRGLIDDHREWAMWQAFRDHIGVRHLVSWNDTPGRTADEVIAALLAAADAAEAPQSATPA